MGAGGDGRAAPVTAPAGVGGHGPAGVGGDAQRARGGRDGARRPGIGAWLPPEGVAGARRVEFRLHVRQGALTVTVLDAEARVPVLPSRGARLAGARPDPGSRRAPPARALRERQPAAPGGRHPRRGRGRAPSRCSKARRVLLEPALMQLRFGDEALRPRFDLEIGRRRHDHRQGRASSAPSDGRRFSLHAGRLVRGRAGLAHRHAGGHRPPHRQARLPRGHAPPAPHRRPSASRCAELTSMITHGLPKVALEVGAELPELSQIADVDRPRAHLPHARGRRASPTASVALRAAYGDAEVEVRADGISPPIIVHAARRGDEARAAASACDIAAQQAAAEQAPRARPRSRTRAAQTLRRPRRPRDPLLDRRASPTLPDDWDLYVPGGARRHAGARQAHRLMNAQASRAAIDWLNGQAHLRERGRRRRSRRARAAASREGKKYVRLDDNSFAPIDADRVQADARPRGRAASTAAGKTGKLPLAQAGRVQELLAATPTSVERAAARERSSRSSPTSTRSSRTKKPQALKAHAAPLSGGRASRGSSFVHDLGSGGVLADDMGLGKTVQTIALLLALKQEEKTDASAR